MENSLASESEWLDVDPLYFLLALWPCPVPLTFLSLSFSTWTTGKQ